MSTHPTSFLPTCPPCPEIVAMDYNWHHQINFYRPTLHLASLDRPLNDLLNKRPLYWKSSFITNFLNWRLNCVKAENLFPMPVDPVFTLYNLPNHKNLITHSAIASAQSIIYELSFPFFNTFSFPKEQHPLSFPSLYPPLDSAVRAPLFF